MRIARCLILLLVLSGCGLFKKVTKTVNKSETSTRIETVTKVDSVVNKTDRSIIVETEKASETKQTPSADIEKRTQLINLYDLVNGLVIIDTGLVTIKQKYDTLSRTLQTFVHIKPQSVTFDVNKTKTTYIDKSEHSSKISEAKKTIAIEDKRKAITKIKDPKTNIIIAVVSAFILLLIGIYLFLRYKASR